MKCYPIDVRLGHVHLVRYEDLCIDPLEATNDLFRFLELPKHNLIEEFIKKRTRSSINIAYRWRGKVNEQDLSNIQGYCKDTIQKVGYSSSSIINTDNASMITMTSEELWPTLDQPILSANFINNMIFDNQQEFFVNTY